MYFNLLAVYCDIGLITKDFNEIHQVTDNVFILSFKFRMPENTDTMIYFAFTYPYSYAELQTSLISMDNRFLTRPSPPSFDDIYYVRECVCKSLENRRVDLITISSYYNITTEREARLQHLFPEENVHRPFKFNNKKVCTATVFFLNTYIEILHFMFCNI